MYMHLENFRDMYMYFKNCTIADLSNNSLSGIFHIGLKIESALNKQQLKKEYPKEWKIHKLKN